MTNNKSNNETFSINNPYYTYVESVLGIFPNMKGIGYAFFKEQNSVEDCGIACIRPMSNKKCMDRLKIMVEAYKPSTIVIPSPIGKYNRKSKRVQQLIKQIHQFGSENDIIIKEYSREEIRFVFNQFGVNSKQEISEKIGKLLPELQHKVPTERNFYEPEPYYQGMFDAISLVITHNFVSY
jgi:Holliday junction resolvasome RuvABC endonuclease subunit